MKTIQKTIEIFKFSELSEDSKQNAINNLSDINVDFEWWEFVCEDAKIIGLKINSFDLYRKNITGYLLLSACEVAQNIFNNHGENCETFKTATKFMNDWQPVFNDYLNEESENYESNELEDIMSDLESNFLNDILEDYLIMLQNDYDYLTSEEAIIETIEANDYDFTEDGKIY